MDTKQTQKIEIPDDIRIYLQAILEEADALILDQEVWEQLLGTMYVQLDQFLTTKLLEKLPNDKLEAFLDLDQEKDLNPEKMQKFVDENVPNSKELFVEAFKEFRDMYLTNIANERNAEEQGEEEKQQKPINIENASLENLASDNA